jgi:D-sedoheptulose 7-phosphate isomerase
MTIQKSPQRTKEAEVMDDYISLIEDYIELEIDVLKKLDVNQINALMNAIEEARQNNATIYIMGNGGSASTASHFANDFNKGLSEYLTKKFNFVCLSDNIATLTAIANDIGYDSVFKFQLEGKLKCSDLMIAVSASGNSPNILAAVEYAVEVGAHSAGLIGFNGGKLKQMVDYPVQIPIHSMQVTEDLQMALDHLMMAVFLSTLCGKEHLKGDDEL